MNYKNRIVEKEIKNNLRVFGCVCVEGAKWCGKTETCKQFAKTIIEFQDPTNKELYKSYINTDPTFFLQKEKPILFDEWQENPNIWDIIRYDIDKQREKGLYLLTGSTGAKENTTMHSGTGRIVKIKMYPMSLFESGDSNGIISLEKIFKKTENVLGESDINISDLARLIIRGGFPEAVNLPLEDAMLVMKGYYKGIINENVASIDGVKRTPRKVDAFLKSYSRNISTLVTDATIRRDMGKEKTTINEVTFIDYKNTLEKLFIIDNVEAWSPKIRSKYRIRTSDKKELVDPAIACAALSLNENKILNDLNTFGFLFESLCIRDLKVYANSLDGNIYHYKDESNDEVDAIIELNDGRWGAIEIKLGADYIEDAAKNLLKFKNKVDTTVVNEPSFLMVLYGGKNAYTRDDGVLVVPIGCLKN